MKKKKQSELVHPDQALSKSVTVMGLCKHSKKTNKLTPGLLPVTTLALLVCACVYLARLSAGVLCGSLCKSDQNKRNDICD